jgi:hypothetical protein
MFGGINCKAYWIIELTISCTLSTPHCYQFTIAYKAIELVNAIIPGISYVNMACSGIDSYTIWLLEMA